jgi:hypothetical protein
MFDFHGKDDKEVAKYLLSNHQHLKNKRRSYEPLWELCNMLFRPRRWDLRRVSVPGKQFGQQVYDGNPANMMGKHVNGLIGNMMNRSVPWLSFGVAKQLLMKDDSLKIYLQECEEQILFSFGRSTFYDESPEAVKDGDCTGTASLVPKYDLINGRVAYQTVHPGETYMENDEYGNSAVYHREFPMTAINAYEKWGDKLPTNIQNKVTGENKDPFAEDKYIYCVYKNANYNASSFRSEEKPYLVFYVCMAKDPVKKQLLERSGQDWFPVTWRPGRESGQAYGLSLAAEALTEALILNKLGQKSLERVHLEVEPAIKASSSLRGRLHARAGGRTWMAAGEEAEELFRSGNALAFVEAWMERIISSMEDKFSIQLLEVLTRDEGRQRTAYEVGEIKKELATLAGGIGTLESEFLNQAIAVQWAHETQAGRMPEIPDILLEGVDLSRVSQFERPAQIDVVYLGPLSQLQRATLQGRGILEGLAIAKEIASVWPNAMVKIKEMEVMEDAMIAQGWKQKHFKSDEETEEILEGIAQSAAEQEQLDAAEQASNIASNMNQPIESEGPLALLEAGAA